MTFTLVFTLGLAFGILLLGIGTLRQPSLDGFAHTIVGLFFIVMAALVAASGVGMYLSDRRRLRR